MRYLLSNSGFLVTPVTTVEKALEEADEYPYDVVLTDLLSPDFAGFELIRKLRKHRWYEEKPMIVVSINNDESVKKQGFEAGITDWVLKPIAPNKFIAMMKSLCPGKDNYDEDYDYDDDDDNRD